MKQAWEYQMVSGSNANAADLMAQINKLGAEGWELVSVTAATQSGAPVIYTVAYLKRPK